MIRPSAALGASLALPLLLCLGPTAPVAAAGRTLRPFRSEAELAALLRRWGEEARRREARRSAELADGTPPLPAPVAGLAEAAPAAAPAPAAESGERGAGESVTNVQEAGVDEGGIVKVHGDHLVILRRGRLFTVRIGGGQLRPVAVVDAFAPGVDPGGTWIDELLIAGDTAVVIGYSYARGGTEVGLFHLGADGAISWRASYQLRSNDYYSSRNYASRQIGSRLILYTPLRLSPWAADPWVAFPAMRRWSGEGEPPPFRRIAPATRIYRTDAPLDPFAGVALHTVTTCELARPEMDCRSTAVLGPPGRVFYVSPRAVYVWTAGGGGISGGGRREDPEASGLFRLPLDGAAPAGLKTRGSPIDQLSFREDGGGTLHVLVRGGGRGEGMWGAERRGGDLALLRVRPEDFGDGTTSAPRRAYRTLPPVPAEALQNRHIGPWLLYGAGAGWGRPAPGSRSPVVAVRVDGGPVTSLPLAHGVDRIEALGNDGLVVGSDGRDLLFSTLRLGGTATPVDRYRRADAAQGETRTHGFFYRPEGPATGLLGLPILAGDEAAAVNLRRPSAAVLFLRNRSLRLSELGTLEAAAGDGRDDGCRASCVDWYGNSRPLFLRNRVFALMGYEIVEGRLERDRIRELRRVEFAPPPAPRR